MLLTGNFESVLLIVAGCSVTVTVVAPLHDLLFDFGDFSTEEINSKRYPD